jgi:hypothetical protein
MSIDNCSRRGAVRDFRSVAMLVDMVYTGSSVLRRFVGEASLYVGRVGKACVHTAPCSGAESCCITIWVHAKLLAAAS